MRSHFLLAATLLLAICVPTAPQRKESNANNRTEKDLAAERLLRERRANAQSLLINLAADARNFTDQVARARTQARVADILWDTDRDRSRALFRAAWDAAEVADTEMLRRTNEAIKQKSYDDRTAPAARDLWREVLRLTAKHDRTLGEEFLAQLHERKGPDGTETNPREAAQIAARQRLDLARQLLDAGETERALQFADPVLGTTTWQAIDFLTYLREKNAAAADQRYAAMLSIAAANPQSDANTMSDLSSYLFTPHFYVEFISQGTLMNAQAAPGQVPAVTTELRLAFFRAAASVLLRPLAPPGAEQNSAGHDGHYLVIKRLLPLFEKYAPPEMTAALRTQLEALTSLASKSTRDRDDDEWVRKDIGPEKPGDDWEQQLLDKLDHAKTSAERDQLNLQLAMVLAGSGDLHARDYVDKIDDPEMRNSVRPYIDASMTMRAISKKDVERLLQIVRTGILTHVQKSWAYSESAKLLSKTDRERALTLIEEAAAEARRIETSDPDRPRAFFGVTNALFLIDHKVAWQQIDETIRAANSADNFSGEDGQVIFGISTKGLNFTRHSLVSDFDVSGIFAAFAAEDYERAVELARGLQRDSPRACATIAIARSVLEPKKH
ncbi:MAG TPA: hypothetical protein VGC60_11210 [Pyrinomonadaceae bacterium]